MENEEPNLVVPRPFPQDNSEEVLNKSSSLDLTPEQPEHKKKGVQRRKIWSKKGIEEVRKEEGEGYWGTVHIQCVY